ncbi:MAG: hypothetical protein QF719_03035 [Chloroflexota bacterium]|jgi:hypothetical protein|nr:hypothetical protein [Chloroflexota bacterium]MDP6508097.1 hypothetical protein [Chloroflexota bacterium]MDP6757176.1 hypothetical protein [Chloroflexota bacterium]|tara:strand:- start:161 stop:406 length:246 start_codon:yes stop_codon:yes gene_type:complete
MQTPNTPPAVNDYPTVVDWFVDNDPQFDTFLTTDDGEMTGFRAICRVLIYVLHEQHGTPFDEVAGDAGANFLRQHSFLPVP